MNPCYLYLLLAVDRSLYTGISEDPARRLREHNRGGRGAKALRGKRPVSLLCLYRCANRVEALRLELQLKRLRAPEKWSLALGNPSDPPPAEASIGRRSARSLGADATNSRGDRSLPELRRSSATEVAR